MRFFDRKRNRLVYIEKKATPEFWDTQWQDEKLKTTILRGATERFIFPTTKKYLPLGSKILEGGCGKGQFVHSLQSRGYNAHGIDFASETVTKINSLLPELHITYGDVRHIDCPDAFYDGYWSLGVIEHFYEGYESILTEMSRVIRSGGYLFLTFPHMSLLRKIKVFLKLYPLFNEKEQALENFYQFALDRNLVIKDLEDNGFELVKKKGFEGFKGLKDELPGPLKNILQKVYNNHSLPSQIFGYALSHLFAPFAGHSNLLVLRKK